MKEIIIVGSGIIGLTSAIRLQEAGYQVQILTKALPMNTTSAKAGAIWFPFKAAPVEKVNHWSQLTYQKYFQEKGKVKKGISMVDFTILANDATPPTWEAAIPPSSLRIASEKELPNGYQYGYIAHVPLIEPPKYLNYLLDTFIANGGDLKEQKIHSLKDLKHPNQIIINCTGLGAKHLANDTSLYPIQGHIAKVKRKNNVKTITDDDGPNALSYVFLRSDLIILGGTAVAGESSEIPDPNVIKELIKRCEQIEPAIKNLSILETTVGLRPGRPQIRLEIDSNGIIHNYGHGGSGYTVCWGCAEAVLELIKKY